jgi:hypothetical protein
MDSDLTESHNALHLEGISMLVNRNKESNLMQQIHGEQHNKL